MRTRVKAAAAAPQTVATFLLTYATTADAIAAHVATTGPTTARIVSPLAARESRRLPG